MKGRGAGGEAILRAMHETRRLPPDHSDAAALLAEMARRFPYWRSGWDMPADAETFVAVYEDGRPVAGAGLCVRGGRADVSRLSTLTPDDEMVGRALLAALEQAARELGCARVRVDETAFLLFPRLPDEYRTGPPYDGDADVPVWAERELG